jgi:hypothetical protein
MDEDSCVPKCALLDNQVFNTILLVWLQVDLFLPMGEDSTRPRDVPRRN